MGYGYGMYYLWDPLYMTVVIISLIIMLWAQYLVKSRYKSYSRIPNSRGLTGADAARAVLSANGVTGVRIEVVSGTMTDHYDPRSNVIRLSEGVCDSTSIAAVGIAAHEAGHAVQYAAGYVPIKIRTAIIPFAQYGPMLGIILMIIGSAINFFNLTVLGLVLFRRNNCLSVCNAAGRV